MFFFSDIFDFDIFDTTKVNSWIPSVKVDVEEDKYLISLDIPGVDEKDIDINTEDSTISIKGERKFGLKTSCRSFSRKFNLPPDVDNDNISATYKYGVLIITIPKLKTKTKKIQIQ